jgi:amino acid transporter
MAFVFATYAQTLWDPLAGTGFPQSHRCYALAATVGLTAINLVGISQAKWTQNILTVLKTVGLLAVAGLAFLGGPREPGTGEIQPLPWSLALILVLFTFGGWNEMAYVAAEVKQPRRNIARALAIGTLAVTALYLLANAAFLYSLGVPGMSRSQAVAVDAVSGVWPEFGSRFVAALICVSALGAVNGLVLTGARISYAVGAGHRVFRFLGLWDARGGAPRRALLLQGAIAAVLILALGSFLNAILYTAATVYSFYLATTVALLVLRRKEPQVDRPYRVFGYPVVPFLFATVCAFLIYSAVVYKPAVAAAWTLLLPAGLLLYRRGRGNEAANRSSAGSAGTGAGRG